MACDRRRACIVCTSFFVYLFAGRSTVIIYPNIKSVVFYDYIIMRTVIRLLGLPPRLLWFACSIRILLLWLLLSCSVGWCEQWRGALATKKRNNTVTTCKWDNTIQYTHTQIPRQRMNESLNLGSGHGFCFFVCCMQTVNHLAERHV